MKNSIILLFLIFSSITIAQTNQTHIPASETMVGIWRQTGLVNPNTGEMMEVISGNYKVINPDKTYFTFVTWGINDPRRPTVIGQYGTYEIISDSSLVEHIVKHDLNAKMTGTSVELRYIMKDKNTLMLAWKNHIDIWVNEVWTRLYTSENKDGELKNIQNETI